MLYLWIAPHHVVDGEDSHFATLGALGGAAHPSGYPLYVLWLRATSWLPGTSPVHTAAIATTILAAAQLVVLHAACRAWGARAHVATFAVAVFAGAPLVLALHSEAEVFALNGLVVAAVLWLAAAGGPARGLARCAALGLVAGLGLANHLTCVLVAPVGLVGLVRGVREAGPARAAAIGLAILGLVVGLLPYGYLVLAPANDAAWGVAGPADVVRMFLRSDYGGPGAFTGAGEPVTTWASLAALARTVGRTWLWLPAIGGVAVVIARIARPAAGEPRAGWIALAASLVLAGPLLVTRFDLVPEGVGLYVVRRFHLLPALLLAPAVAVLIDELAAAVARRVRTRPPAAVVAVAGVAAFLAAAGPSLDYVARAHVPAVEQEAVNTLRSLPPDAVVIAIGDDLAGAIPYAQLVLGERRDVVFVEWAMLPLPWYRARLALRGVAGSSGVEMIGWLLARGRPVFVEPALPELVRAFPHYPYGVLEAVLPRDAKAPTLDEVFAREQRLFAAFELGYPRPRAGDEWPAAVHARYAATWRQLGRALEAAGKRDEAAWAVAAARDLGPQ